MEFILYICAMFTATFVIRCLLNLSWFSLSGARKMKRDIELFRSARSAVVRKR